MKAVKSGFKAERDFLSALEQKEIKAIRSDALDRKGIDFLVEVNGGRFGVQLTLNPSWAPKLLKSAREASNRGMQPVFVQCRPASVRRVASQLADRFKTGSSDPSSALLVIEKGGRLLSQEVKVDDLLKLMTA